MADKYAILKDENGNNLYPSTKFLGVTDANGLFLPSDFSTIAKTSDIPNDLADLNDDSTHRLVTDTEKTTWSGKQDALPTTTTAGQVLKSTSTAGTVEWGTVSGGGSTDVQINGTSITSNGVANLVTNTAYDSSSNKVATMSDVKERIDVIYDMRSDDSTINRGLTSGATCGTTFRLDFSQYTSIRLFCSINNCEVMKVLKTAERKKSDFGVSAINSTFDKINYFRFTFPTNNTVLQVGQYGIYSFDLDNNTFSVEKGAIHTSFYVYRLEGIY